MARHDVQRGEIRIKLPTLLLLLAVVAGGSFAAGSAVPTSSAAPTQVQVAPAEMPEQAPPLEQEQELPPGHPPIDDTIATGTGADTPGADDAPLEWKTPARWQVAPNTNTMRLATYRVPRAPGDATDAELSVTRAGGSADANAERWIRQFDDGGQKSAKRTSRKVGLLDVTVVEVQGTYSGGMGKDGAPQSGWALLGAIVSTTGMPTFFKLTGPAKSVLAARSEFDAFVASLVPRQVRGT
jgi:hypothetical protein